MKKKLGMLLAVVLTFCMSAVVFADAGKTQQVDYKTDYYMIVESPDGGIDMYSEASVDSPKLNDELIPNGTAIHVEGESTDEAYIKHILPRKMRYNLDYLKKAGVVGDIKIMIKTVLEVIK